MNNIRSEKKNQQNPRILSIPFKLPAVKGWKTFFIFSSQIFFSSSSLYALAHFSQNLLDNFFISIKFTIILFFVLFHSLHALFRDVN